MTRAERVQRLYVLQAQVNSEIAEIEQEIRDEIEATARAKARAREVSALVRRARVAKCGTESGYARHRRVLKESACDACKLAHRVYEAHRVARKEATA